MLEQIERDYDSENDVPPTGPVVTWAEKAIYDEVKKLSARVKQIENAIGEELESHSSDSYGGVYMAMARQVKEFSDVHLAEHKMRHFASFEAALRPETILKVYEGEVGTIGQDIIMALCWQISALMCVLEEKING